ncbi:MAG: winged helix DNA-binding domain-containing protein [Kutzneria sp.]|nr:winged helix DNA-binding domain-containing protein [Kutzneria sp.]MBV9845878.1 winged helix DNA-binding domain-containing protein [Kutzneria sp.]
MGTEDAVAKLRAWWAHRQGLDGALAGASAAEVLASTGWARSVGSSGPYLGLFARAGLDRDAVDKAVAALEIHELPSARGCTYVLPRRDFALGLAVGAHAPERDIQAAAKHLGVTRAEIEELADAAVGVLATTDRPLDPAALKTSLGDAVRDLGEAGRKRGEATPLRMALGLLQAQGRIRRVPVNGRLDNQRFGYALWSPPPLSPGGTDGEAANTELAARYFSWAAPATLKHFQWFSGLTAAAAKKAVAPLDLRAVDATPLLMPADQMAEFERFTVPRAPSYSLLASIDGIHLLHRDLGRLLDPDDAHRRSPEPGDGRTLGSQADPPCPLIVDRGRIVGLWEYDVDATEVVYHSFVEPDSALRNAVADTEAFIRGQLGDAKMVSLDSPKSRAPRLAALREASGHR